MVSEAGTVATSGRGFHNAFITGRTTMDAQDWEKPITPTCGAFTRADAGTRTPDTFITSGSRYCDIAGRQSYRAALDALRRSQTGGVRDMFRDTLFSRG